MQKKVLVLVDLSNLYYHVKKKFNRKVDYEKYLTVALAEDHLFKAIAYGGKVDETSDKFFDCLKRAGYELRVKTVKQGQQANWNVGIAVDAMRMATRYDVVVLGSSDAMLSPMLRYLNDQGIHVHIFGAAIPAKMGKLATTYEELDEEVLENASDKTT